MNKTIVAKLLVEKLMINADEIVLTILYKDNLNYRDKSQITLIKGDLKGDHPNNKDHYYLMWDASSFYNKARELLGKIAKTKPWTELDKNVEIIFSDRRGKIVSDQKLAIFNMEITREEKEVFYMAFVEFKKSLKK